MKHATLDHKNVRKPCDRGKRSRFALNTSAFSQDVHGHPEGAAQACSFSTGKRRASLDIQIPQCYGTPHRVTGESARGRIELTT